MIQIPCVIFAGGRSSRMGEDKALLPFDGYATLTQYQYAKASKIFSHVYISCKEKSKFSFDANFIEDFKEPTLFAPTLAFASIYATLNESSFFALSVDAPFVDEAVIQRLIEEDRPSYDATIAKTAFGMQPLCGIYHRSLEKEFLEMLQKDSHKLGYLLKNSQTHFVFFEEEKKFLNLNNPQEYQQALQEITKS